MKIKLMQTAVLVFLLTPVVAAFTGCKARPTAVDPAPVKVVDSTDLEAMGISVNRTRRTGAFHLAMNGLRTDEAVAAAAIRDFARTHVVDCFYSSMGTRLSSRFFAGLGVMKDVEVVTLCPAAMDSLAVLACFPNLKSLELIDAETVGGDLPEFKNCDQFVSDGHASAQAMAVLSRMPRLQDAGICIGNDFDLSSFEKLPAFEHTEVFEGAILSEVEPATKNKMIFLFKQKGISNCR